MKDPVAFLSYVQNDDAHERGKISALRDRLEGELRMLTGETFRIFQDRNDIEWGQQWESRINETINSVIFLIPIVTPTYFASPACRSEYKKFLIREKTLGEDSLIFPLYYVACDRIANEKQRKNDDIATSIASRQWTDWRPLRFKDLESPEAGEAIFRMATAIKNSIDLLGKVAEAAKTSEVLDEVEVRSFATTKSPLPPPTVPPTSKSLYVDGKATPEIENTREMPYYVFTKDNDEVISPSELADADEMMRLHEILTPKIHNVKTLFSTRLHDYRKVIAFFDKKASISILIDNSGSMRGEKSFLSSAWISIFAEEICKNSIPLEILGFTTRAWRGGLSRELWLKAGEPRMPGRLNDLRLLVYKSFKQSQTDAILNLSLMMREGLLKENIDGESLQWAYERALKSGSKRKIIIVLSDGAPVDDSTLNVCGSNFLSDHLREVIRWIQYQAGFILIGIGIEYSVERYYDNSFIASATPALGEALFEALSWAKTQL